MLTTYPHYWSEKKSLNNNYSGELCDLMGHYLKFRYELLISYVIAVVIKFYNNYYQFWIQINIEAR